MIHTSTFSDDSTPKFNVGGRYEASDGNWHRYVKSVTALVAKDVAVLAAPGQATAAAPKGTVVTKTTSALGAGVGTVEECAGVATYSISAGNYGFIQVGGSCNVSTTGTVIEGDVLVPNHAVDGTAIAAVAGTAHAGFAVAQTKPGTGTQAAGFCWAKFRRIL